MAYTDNYDPVAQADANRAFEDAEKNYWAPDRDAELARRRAAVNSPGTSTSGSNPWAPQTAGSQTNQPSNNNPPTSFNREGFRDSWMSTGTDVNRQNELLKKYNLTPDAAGRVRLPTGETIDLRFGAKAGINRASWTGIAGQGAKTGQTPGFGGGSDPRMNDGSTGNARGGSSSSSSTSMSGVSQELYDLLLNRARQGTQIDPNDPNIKQQTEPYAAAQERSRRDYLADLAESEGSLANLRGEQRLASERAGQNVGMFQAELIGRELTARRDEIKHALDSLRGQLTADQTLALQKELAYLEDATRRYGIKTEAGIAKDQLGLGRDRLGYDIGRSDAELWLRSQGL